MRRSNPIRSMDLHFSHKAIEKNVCTRIQSFLAFVGWFIFRVIIRISPIFSLVDNIMTDCMYNMVREACDALKHHVAEHKGSGLCSAERLPYVQRSMTIENATKQRRRLSMIMGLVWNIDFVIANGAPCRKIAHSLSLVDALNYRWSQTISFRSSTFRSSSSNLDLFQRCVRASVSRVLRMKSLISAICQRARPP